MYTVCKFMYFSAENCILTFSEAPPKVHSFLFSEDDPNSSFVSMERNEFVAKLSKICHFDGFVDAEFCFWQILVLENIPKSLKKHFQNLWNGQNTSSGHSSSHKIGFIY